MKLFSLSQVSASLKQLSPSVTQVGALFIVVLAITLATTITACSHTEPPVPRNTAEDIKAAAEATKTSAEVIELKSPVTKVVITNTSGSTTLGTISAVVGDPSANVQAANGTSASLHITKVKTSEICEFKQEQKGPTLNVMVRNRDFTGAGDCEINLDALAPQAQDVTVVSTSGSVTLNLPKAKRPQVEFKTKNGQITSDFEISQKGDMRITVRTQSGNLFIKAL